MDIVRLSKKEQIELGRRSRNGDTKAREKLIVQNMDLARSAVLSYSPKDEIRDDMFQEAFKGLVIAVDKYNPDKNTTFGTFAIWHMRSCINRSGILFKSPVYFPAGQREVIRAIRKTYNNICAETGRAPDYKEVAERTGACDNTVLYAIDMLSESDPENQTIKPTVDEELTKLEVMHKLKEAISELPEIEQYVVNKLLGMHEEGPVPISYIASTIGMSQQGASYVKDRAFAKLRKKIGKSYYRSIIND